MSTLKGSDDLKARLKAIKLSFKPAGKAWAEATSDAMKPLTPVRTGKGRQSIRVKNASQKLATVQALWYIHILDVGAKAHDITAKRANTLVFTTGGRTIFAKKVHKPQARGMGFARKASQIGLQRAPLAEEIIKQWNAAA